VRAPAPEGDRHERCQLHCRNSDTCRGSRRLCGSVLPALWLLVDLLPSVRLQLSSELQLLSSRIRLLSGPLRLRVDWRLLPQLQRNTLRSAGYVYPSLVDRPRRVHQLLGRVLSRVKQQPPDRGITPAKGLRAARQPASASALTRWCCKAELAMPPLVQLPPELWPGRSPWIGCGSAFQRSGAGEEPADRLLQRPAHVRPLGR
jgi:hypothetical protein